MQIIEHRLLTEHRYAIVDGSQREQVPVHWAQQVIAPAFLKEDTGRCPLLVDLRSLSQSDHDTWLERTLSQWQSQETLWCSALLVSDAEMDAVHAHLRLRLALNVPGSERPLQFRFYDPHTLTHLPHLLGADGLRWLMGPVSGITYSLPFTQQRVFSHLNRPTDPEHPSPAFVLTAEHRSALQRLSTINRVLVQLPPVADEAAWRKHSQQADALAQRAQRYGLAAQEDEIAFVLHGLTMHNRFDTHSRIKALLNELKQAQPEDELSYLELTSRMSEADWQQLVRELPAASDAVTSYTPNPTDTDKETL